MLPFKFRFIWQSSFRGEDFQKSTNQKQELPVAAMFVNRWGRNEHSIQRTFQRCFLPSFGSFSKAVSEEKIFRNRPIRNKNCLWWPCLLLDQDKISNLHRGVAIDTSLQVSVYLDKQLKRRQFLEINQSKTRTAVPTMFVNGSGKIEQNSQRTCHRCFPSSFGSFGQTVSEEKIFQKSTNQKQELPVVAMLLTDRN